MIIVNLDNKMMRAGRLIMVMILLALSTAKAAAAGAPADPEISVILLLRSQANLAGAAAPPARLRPADRAAQIQSVIETLQAQARTDQPAVLTHLNRLRAAGKVTQVQPLWIVNAVVVTTRASALAELAARPEVAQVWPNRAIQPVGTVSPQQAGSPPANLQQIHVPEVWALGYQGQGVVVANIDSGVSLNVPSLADSWRGRGGGASVASSWYDVYGEYATPTDISGHGTATMSIMVGDDYGIAPQAEWIAVKIFTRDPQNPSKTISKESDALMALQWLLDPDHNPATADAPDVVNNSWDFTAPVAGQPCDNDPTLHAALQALTAANIVPVFSAGNYSTQPPPLPAAYPEALAVGAVDSLNHTASFSSRGPTNCRVSGQMFPDFAAPGVGIPVNTPNNTPGTADGTSFAAPHVAGGLAVLLSAFPNLTTTQQRSALIMSAADIETPGPDQLTGYGLININRAYQLLKSGIRQVYLPSVSKNP